MGVSSWRTLGSGRVNPLIPAIVVLAGAVTFGLGFRFIGAGIAIGACLAFINALMLSRRVELAADTGDMARAMMVMQIGLVSTFVIIGVATVILVKISLAMAVAAAAGFGVAQLAILAAFYLTRARHEVVSERTV